MILVIGCGFVGETVAKSLEENGQEVVRIDPKYNDNKIADYKDEAVCAIVAVLLQHQMMKILHTMVVVMIVSLKKY